MCDSTKHGANGYIIDKMKENNDNNKENVILLEDHYNLIFILYLMESESSKNVGQAEWMWKLWYLPAATDFNNFRLGSRSPT